MCREGGAVQGVPGGGHSAGEDSGGHHLHAGERQQGHGVAHCAWQSGEGGNNNDKMMFRYIAL